MAQEVGGRQLHLEEAYGCMAREGENNRDLREGGKESHFLACAGSSAPGGVGRGLESEGGSRTMES